MNRCVYALAVWALFSNPSWGNDRCTRNSSQIDVCRVAATIASAISPSLPFHLTESLVLHRIEALQNRIVMSAFFVYTETYLRSRLRHGVSVEALRAGVWKNAFMLACRPDTDLQAFVNQGGSLEFVYLFSDAEPFVTVQVNQCAGQ
jgi:hypothetical protein